MISPWCGLALQFGGAVVITGFITAALVSLSLGRDVLRARLLVAEGVIGGLGVMTAATLLRTIASHLAADLEAIRRGYGNGLKELSPFGLCPYRAQQAADKAAQLFFSGGDRGNPDEGAGTP